MVTTVYKCDLCQMELGKLAANIRIYGFEIKGSQVVKVPAEGATNHIRKSCVESIKQYFPIN